MRGVNKVILLGTLGRDPETRTFAGGGSITTVSLATSEQWKDKVTGESKEQTEWHRVVFSNRLAEIAAEYLRKGSKVYVEGQLRTRKWQDQSGNDRYTTEVVLQGPGAVLTMLDGANGGQRSSGGDDYRGNEGAGQSQADSYGGSFYSDDLDDEVPF